MEVDMIGKPPGAQQGASAGAAQVSKEELQHAASQYFGHFWPIVEDLPPSFFQGRGFTCGLTGIRL